MTSGSNLRDRISVVKLAKGITQLATSDRTLIALIVKDRYENSHLGMAMTVFFNNFDSVIAAN